MRQQSCGGPALQSASPAAGRGTPGCWVGVAGAALAPATSPGGILGTWDRGVALRVALGAAVSPWCPRGARASLAARPGCSGAATAPGGFLGLALACPRWRCHLAVAVSPRCGRVTLLAVSPRCGRVTPLVVPPHWQCHLAVTGSPSCGSVTSVAVSPLWWCHPTIAGSPHCWCHLIGGVTSL